MAGLVLMTVMEIFRYSEIMLQVVFVPFLRGDTPPAQLK